LGTGVKTDQVFCQKAYFLSQLFQLIRRNLIVMGYRKSEQLENENNQFKKACCGVDFVNESSEAIVKKS
jgi:hypothetical protein